MRARPYAAMLVLLAAGLGGGCGTSAQPAASPHGAPGLLSTALVMPATPPTADEAWSWEYGRNDERLNAGRAPVVDESGWSEIRTRERLRTTNGKSREFSSTFVRTIRQRSH